MVTCQNVILASLICVHASAAASCWRRFISCSSAVCACVPEVFEPDIL